jgi:hypothetical protein
MPTSYGQGVILVGTQVQYDPGRVVPPRESLRRFPFPFPKVCFYGFYAPPRSGCETSRPCRLSSFLIFNLYLSLARE